MRRLIALSLIGALAGCGQTSSGSHDQAAATPAATAKAHTAWGRAKAGLRDKFGDRIVDLSRIGRDVTIGVKADDNLTKGMIRSGMKFDAGDAFKAFHDAGYTPSNIVVQFHMTLTDTATGRDSDGIVAVYSLPRAAFRQIVWANNAAIDWDAYRTMLHPAMQ